MTRIAAHRGGTLEYGDSTPQGFAATATMALEQVEFDVHPTSDGATIVHHDATLDRTTDRTGAIAALTEAEVRAATINFGAGAHPLTLAELCAVFRPSPVDLRCEIKPDEHGRPYTNFVPRVIATLGEQAMLERTTFTSFLLETLDELAPLTMQPRLWLVSPPVLRQLGIGAVIELAQARSIGEIGLHVDDADRTVKTALEQAGLIFGCWAAHSVEQMEKALALEAHVFTTDRPSLAIEVRNRRLEGLSE
ncbi:glycerophosphodiester phosphodiesterase family protein [Devosia beringensis]|uniref:glycerophosphodiester phosphodiesterase family protein n=1 Tax=Devosia beringensis TaxID=2657486 RepID=UPI00186B9942|nr:glycerophosphodiester phosphodiesterase family protein [Devosia beringensis]